MGSRYDEVFPRYMQTLDSTNLREIIDNHFEWLAILGTERPFSLRRDEIDFENTGTHYLFGFIGHKGYKSFRINSFENDSSGLKLELSGVSGIQCETLHLTPRISAADLNSDAQIAKLKIAEKIAEEFKNNDFPKIKNITIKGRFVQISLSGRNGNFRKVIHDLTGTINHESLLAAAISKCSDQDNFIKHNVIEICITAKKKVARELRKLLALLKPSLSSKISVYEMSDALSGEKFIIKKLTSEKIQNLWLSKHNKTLNHRFSDPGVRSMEIINQSVNEMDVVFTKKGETIRFNGLPFARVREVAGNSDVWFGLGKRQSLLNDKNESRLSTLISDLETYRRASSVSLRHELFRKNPEAWLEFKLRQNIRRLDPNLFLSPVHHQFTAAGDKIDLLALRNDGRLVIIEVKINPDKETVFQVADYWKKVELQRRTGILDSYDIFNGRKIADVPALVYVVAPALSFHNSFDDFSRMIIPEIELWKWELHRNWRERITVLSRKSYFGDSFL